MSPTKPPSTKPTRATPPPTQSKQKPQKPQKPVMKAGIIGWPVSHSRSPLIHNYWIKKHQLAAHYEPCPIDPADDFRAALKALAADGFIGANVTRPHKQVAFAAMDRLTPTARKLGAVNTISFVDGQLHGANTDGEGFIAGLDEAAPDAPWRDRPVLVLGAGGAARAIIVALGQAGVAQIRLANRTMAKAEALRSLTDRLEIMDWAQRLEASQNCGLLVNTTSLGMHSYAPLDMPLGGLGDGALVSDIVYTPLITDLLTGAAAHGLVAVNGLGMLLHQAAFSFEIWFGMRPHIDDDLRHMLIDDLPE